MIVDEVISILRETLGLAEANYDSWEDYHSYFVLERKNWNPTSPDSAEFARLTKAMQQGEDSIYKLIPLN